MSDDQFPNMSGTAKDPEYRDMLAAVQGAFSEATMNLLRRALDDDNAALAQLLPIAYDILNVLVATDLLEFVYMPNDSDDIAWFSIETVETHEERKSVVLFGMPTQILGGPLTIEPVTDAEEPAAEDDDNSDDDEGVQVRIFERSVLSGKVGGRGGRVFAASLLAYQDERAEKVRTEEEVAERLLSPRQRRNYDMVRLVYAAYLLRLEYGQRFPRRRSVVNAPGISTLLVSSYPPKNHRFHIADPTCPSFAWHTEGAPIA